jgi:hypothetical protein
LSATLIVLVLSDSVLTLAQALSYNLARLRGVTDVLIVSVALAAPTLVSVVLLNAHRRSSRASAMSVPRE